MKGSLYMNESSELINRLNTELLEVKIKKEEYRLYYDNEGIPLFYSSGDFPKFGTYITISKEIYDKGKLFQVKVKNNELISVAIDYHFRVQLIKSKTENEYRAAKGHAGILDENKELIDIEYFRKNFNKV